MTSLQIQKWAATALISSAVFPAWAQGQVHEAMSDRYVLRSSAINSLSIPEASAKAAGIRHGANVGILNVTVVRKGSQMTETVPAKVEAYSRNLTGTRQKIRLKESKADGWVSYTGTFRVAPREVLDFHISARPADAGQPLEMTYREQIWVDQKDP